jgi:hypothetical protein
MTTTKTKTKITCFSDNPSYFPSQPWLKKTRNFSSSRVIAEDERQGHFFSKVGKKQTFNRNDYEMNVHNMQ